MAEWIVVSCLTPLIMREYERRRRKKEEKKKKEVKEEDS